MVVVIMAGVIMVVMAVAMVAFVSGLVPLRSIATRTSLCTSSCAITVASISEKSTPERLSRSPPSSRCTCEAWAR